LTADDLLICPGEFSFSTIFSPTAGDDHASNLLNQESNGYDANASFWRESNGRERQKKLELNQKCNHHPRSVGGMGPFGEIIDHFINIIFFVSV